jgi:single-strand DNA-binding protein
MNHVTLMGNVGGDPEYKAVGDGGVCSFSLATNEGQKDKDGQKVTEWHRISAWGRTGELCRDYLRKGSQVLIQGNIQYSTYEKDGVKMYATQINAHRVEFIGKAPDQARPDNPKPDSVAPF